MNADMTVVLDADSRNYTQVVHLPTRPATGVDDKPRRYSFAEIKRRYFLEGTSVTLVEVAVQERDGTWTVNPDHKNLGVTRRVGRMNSVEVYFVNEEGQESWLRFGKASDWNLNDDGNVVNEADGQRLVYAFDRSTATATKSEPDALVPKAPKRRKYPTEWRRLSCYEVEDMIVDGDERSDEFMYFVAVHSSVKVLEAAWGWGLVEQMPDDILHFFWNNKKMRTASYREDAYKAVVGNPHATAEMVEYILRNAVFKETHERARLAAKDIPSIDPALLEWKSPVRLTYVR